MAPRILPEARKAAHARARGRCEWCGTRGNRLNWELHVHHLTYARFHKERPEDLVVLCLDCHSKAHDGRTFHTRAERYEISQRRKAKRKGRGKWDAQEIQARLALAANTRRLRKTERPFGDPLAR